MHFGCKTNGRALPVAFLGIAALLPVPAARATELASPSAAAVNASISAPFIRFHRNISGGAHTNGAWNGGASITLAVASHAGNTAADSRLLGQIRYTLIAGNEPTSNGGYPAQHEKQVTAMFVIVKNTPHIWSQLSATEKTRIDLIMKATFIASVFTTGDNNPYIKAGTQQYALDGDSNLNRDWNPNYREGMIGGVLVGVAYFGGGSAANAFLTSYSHSQFVADLTANNLPNIHETFNWKAANPSSSAPSGSVIDPAVRTYRYYGYALADFMHIYEELANDTYQGTVNAGLNNGAGINGAGKIVSGAATLPNPGALGMLKEFETGDGGGPRSSLLYAYDGYRPHMSNQLALIVSGLWPKGSAITHAAVARQKIGNIDLWYKAEKGYIGYSKGVSEGEASYATSGTNYGFVYNRSLWEEVLKPYHDGADPDPGFAVGSRIETGSSAQVHISASAAALLNGLLPAGSCGTILEGPVTAGGIIWWRAVFDVGAIGWIRTEDFTAAPAAESFTATAGSAWRNLALSPQTGTFVISFNMSCGATGMDGVAGLSATSASAYSDLAVALRFATTGVIDARNGGSYQAAGVLNYAAGVIYRVMLTVNPGYRTYSATVTPAGGSPVVIASSYAFRTEQASVASLANLAALANGGSLTVSGIRFGAQGGPPSTPTGVHKD
ncbi:MAG: hypothetical protein Q8Q59_00645 [Luteolibacter sp.]|jgi:hypothetical protein|nr:hypothetical protein [Luteolibacter sp.]